MNPVLPHNTLDQLFLSARTHFKWLPKPVTDEQLHQIYDLARMAPTSANCSPMRLVFVKTAEGKARLKPALDEMNVEKTLSAPVTAIVAIDTEFYEQLPKLFPHADARSWFVGNQPLIDSAGFRNGSLQGAYVIMAARALGLDCGPMSGFNNARLDEIFFKGTAYKSNFLINLGYGDATALFPRGPRLDFDEACKIV